MSLFHQIFQTALARDIFSLPRYSLSKKAVLFGQAYTAKTFKVLRRRWVYARGHSFESKLEKLVRDDPLEYVPCPICRTPPPTREGKDVFHGLTLNRCPLCGLRYISPRLSRNGLKKLYTRSYYFEYRVWLGHPIKSEGQAEEIVLSHRRLSRAEQWRPPGKILDIGCSTGQLLIAARERGYDPYGVELNPWAVRHARENSGLDVLQGPLEGTMFKPGSFDLVTLIDVLEHLPDPVVQMTMAAGLLRPGGIVMVTLPNGGCAEARDNLLAWKHLKPWEHICLYDSASLKTLGGRAGLELIDVDTELSAGVGYVGALMGFFRKADFDIPSTASLISIRADGARGDTLLTTPILKGLRRRFPEARLRVETHYPSLLEGLEGVETVPADAPAGGDAQVRARYEIEPENHMVDVMTRYCRAGKPDHHIYYRVREDEKKLAGKILQEAGVEYPAVGLHPMTGSRIKRWNEGKWRELAERLTAQGVCPVLVGSRDDTTPIPGTIDLRGLLSPRKTLAVLGELDLFVGLDSFPAHAAGAVRTPRVILFGSTDPERILCDLDTCPTIVLPGDCPYLGCRQDCLPDQWIRNIECRRGEPFCLDVITPDEVFNAAIKLLEK